MQITKAEHNEPNSVSERVGVSPLVVDGPVVTVDRCAELMHCSRRKVFELLEAGTLRRAKCYGRHTLVVTATVYEALDVEPAAIIPLKALSRKATAELVAAKIRAGRAQRRADRQAALKATQELEP